MFVELVYNVLEICSAEISLKFEILSHCYIAVDSKDVHRSVAEWCIPMLYRSDLMDSKTFIGQSQNGVSQCYIAVV